MKVTFMISPAEVVEVLDALCLEQARRALRGYPA
jgi:hypothetical protein